LGSVGVQPARVITTILFSSNHETATVKIALIGGDPDDIAESQRGRPNSMNFAYLSLDPLNNLPCEAVLIDFTGTCLLWNLFRQEITKNK
jgi:hypothetical protein